MEIARRIFRSVLPYVFIISFAVMTLIQCFNGCNGLIERVFRSPGLVVGVIISVIILTLSLKWCVDNPVFRDRWLSRESSVWKLGALVTLIVTSLFVLVGFAIVRGVQPVEVMNGSEGKGSENLFWTVLAQYADPGNLGSSSGRGQSVALAAAIMGVVLMTGLTTSVIVSMMNQRIDMWKKGLLRYRRTFKRHVVIIGANEQVVTIIKKSISEYNCLVLILTSREVEPFRSYIETQLTTKEERRVIIYHGLQTARESISQLQLNKAREVYILGESVETNNQGNHDALNIRSLKLIEECVASRKEKLKCHVAFEYHSAYGVYKHTGITVDKNSHIEFLPFSVYEVWARRVLVDNSAGEEYAKRFEKMQNRMAQKTQEYDQSGQNENKSQDRKPDDKSSSQEELDLAYGHYEYPFYYKPLETWDEKDDKSRKAIDYNSNKRVHLVIIGMNKMGRALAAEAIQLMHFPNYLRDDELRTTITFVDPKSLDDVEVFRSRYANFFSLAKQRVITCCDDLKKGWEDPLMTKDGRFSHLAPNFMDIQCEFVHGNAALPWIRDYLSQIVNDPNRICTIACCQSQPQQALATALYLPEIVFKRAIQVLVYQRGLPDLPELLSEGDNKWKRYRKLKPFGMLEDCYTDNSLSDYKPKLANYFYQCFKDRKKMIGFNQAYKCILSGEKDLAGVLNIDEKEVEQEWDKLPIAYKWSSIYYVLGFSQKLRAVGCDTKTDPKKIVEKFNFENNPELLVRLAQTEHNRWLTERLLMGFRPLDNNEKEWKWFECEEKKNPDDKVKDEKIMYKKKLKDKSRAHLDIASNDTVNRMDSEMHLQDENNIRAIPVILALAKERKDRERKATK